jgi:hypothetical protein
VAVLLVSVEFLTSRFTNKGKGSGREQRPTTAWVRTVSRARPTWSGATRSAAPVIWYVNQSGNQTSGVFTTPDALSWAIVGPC